MHFWLCRQSECFGGGYILSTYCPYRSSPKDPDCLRFGTNPFWLYANDGVERVNPGWKTEDILFVDLYKFGGEIPYLTCKNLVTGQILQFDDLLTIEDYKKRKYYSFGLHTA